MINLYYWPTPNGNKITMMLEECGLDYTTSITGRPRTAIKLR